MKSFYLKINCLDHFRGVSTGVLFKENVYWGISMFFNNSFLFFEKCTGDIFNIKMRGEIQKLDLPERFDRKPHLHIKMSAG